jgi:hypothetical protein
VDRPDRVSRGGTDSHAAWLLLSVTRPGAQRPNGVIGLVYVAGLALGVGAVTLGLGSAPLRVGIG